MAIAVRSVSSNSANANTVTVTKPSGTIDGDYLVATCGTRNGTCSAPAGWTSVGEVTYDTNRSTIFYRIASSEGASYIFTNNGGASGIAVGITAITGADTTAAPIYAGQSNGISGTCTAPTITPTAHSLIMLVCSVNGSATGISAQAIATSNPGLTEQYEVHAPNNGGDGVATAIATGLRPQSTATGSGTATLSASERSAGQLVSIPAVITLLDDLRAYYKLDESSGNATDSSGAGLTLTNTNTVGFATGLINNGADFGSTNTNKWFTRASHFGVDISSAFSVSVWMKVATEPGSGEDQTIFRGGANGNNVEWLLNYRSPGGTKELTFTRSKAGVGAQSANYAVTLGTSAWKHIVGTYDGTTLRLYLNGTEVDTTAASGAGSSGPTSANEIHLGGQNEDVDYGTIGYVRGMLDAVGFWSRVLTTTEITRLYNSGTGVQYPFPDTVSFSVSDTITASESTPTTTYIKRSDTFTLSEVITIVKSVVFSVSDTVTLSSVITTTQGVLSRIIRPLIARIRRILPTSTRAKKQ